MAQYQKVNDYFDVADAGRRHAGRRRPCCLRGRAVRAQRRLLRPADRIRRRDQHMRIAREEIFGPVLAVIAFDDEDEAVRGGQRHRARPGSRPVDHDVSPGAAGVGRAPGRQRLRQRLGRRRLTCRSAVTRTAATDARRASPRWRTSPRSRASSSTGCCHDGFTERHRRAGQRDPLRPPASRGRRAHPAHAARLDRRVDRRVGQTPSARIAQRVAAAEGGRAVATIVGTNLRSRRATAALANGVAAHALDYDDGNRWAGTHPSAPVISAVAALADDLEATGAQLIEAIVAGVQALCLIGFANGPSTTPGASTPPGPSAPSARPAGCARSARIWTPKRNRPCPSPSRDPGRRPESHVRHHGQTPQRRPRRGVTACGRPTGRRRLRRATQHHRGAAGIRGRAKRQPRPGPRARGRAVRRRAGAVQALRLLRRRPLGDRGRPGHPGPSAGHPAPGGQRAAAGLRRLLDVCDIPVPTSGTEGKFSVPYAAALALAGEAAGPADFTDDAVRRPQLLGLLDRIELDAGLTATPRTRSRHLATSPTGRPRPPRSTRWFRCRRRAARAWASPGHQVHRAGSTSPSAVSAPRGCCKASARSEVAAGGGPARAGQGRPCT